MILQRIRWLLQLAYYDMFNVLYEREPEMVQRLYVIKSTTSNYLMSACHWQLFCSVKVMYYLPTCNSILEISVHVGLHSNIVELPCTPGTLKWYEDSFGTVMWPSCNALLIIEVLMIPGTNGPYNNLQFHNSYPTMIKEWCEVSVPCKNLSRFPYYSVECGESVNASYCIPVMNSLKNLQSCTLRCVSLNCFPFNDLWCRIRRSSKP